MGLGQARVWAASIGYKKGSNVWLFQSWNLTLVNVHWWPYENNTWKTPGAVVSIFRIEMGSKGVPKRMYFVSPHNRQKMTQQRTLTGKQLWQRTNQWLLSQSCLPCVTAQKWIWVFLLQQLGGVGRRCPWQGINNHRAKRSPHSISNAGSGHYISHTYYQGYNGQHTLRKEAADIRTKHSHHTKKILNPHRLYRDTPT